MHDMWWNEMKLIIWRDEEDYKCTIKLTENNYTGAPLDPPGLHLLHLYHSTYAILIAFKIPILCKL